MPRDGDGRAIIPDRRNDENLIIVQLHKAVAQFHNRIVDYARAQGIRPEWVFETARRLTRWHYQWAVIHDFLPRFVGDELVGPNGTVYKEVAGKPPVINLNYYKPTNREGRPFMPVEFAVAAYRFGHSLIRPFYVINDSGIVDIFGPAEGFNLNGGRPIPGHRVPIRVPGPARLGSRARSTRCRFRSLPGSAVPPPDPTIHLAVRNTLRGKRVGLPSGQQVARAMRVNVLSNASSDSVATRDGAARRRCGSTSLKEAELPPYKGEQRAGGWPDHGRDPGRASAAGPNSYLYLNAAWKPAPPIAPAPASSPSSTY